MAGDHGAATAAALRDIRRAWVVEDGLLDWIRNDWGEDPQPLAADVWVFSPDFRRVLTVRHRWRGLVPPGGRVEPGETPYEGAARELAEETGLQLVPRAEPAFAAARSYRSDWLPTLSLSYWTTTHDDVVLAPEAGQPARWVELSSDWRTYHADDARVMIGFARKLAARRCL